MAVDEAGSVEGQSLVVGDLAVRFQRDEEGGADLRALVVDEGEVAAIAVEALVAGQLGAEVIDGVVNAFGLDHDFPGRVRRHARHVHLS